MGAANFSSSMQHAICASVTCAKLDDGSFVCWRQHNIKSVQATAFVGGMQPKHAAPVLACKPPDRLHQLDSKLTAGTTGACHWHCICIHVGPLLRCLHVAQPQYMYQPDKATCGKCKTTGLNR